MAGDELVQCLVACAGSGEFCRAKALPGRGDDCRVVGVLVGIFDAVLIVVVALLLYAISAREPGDQPGWFDVLQVVMVCAAMVIDLVVLRAMIGRLGTFGATPNRLVLLGLNLILLVNLLGSLWWHIAFVRGRWGGPSPVGSRARLASLMRWQTAFLPVLLAWAALVVAALPPLFGFA